MIKILIADDEPLVQIGLRSMISWSSLGAEICGTASNGDAAWEMIREHHPDIVITDIQMPCSSGLELGKRLRTDHPKRSRRVYLYVHTSSEEKHCIRQ